MHLTYYVDLGGHYWDLPSWPASVAQRYCVPRSNAFAFGCGSC